MRINGKWLCSPDGTVRPTVIVDVLGENNVWQQANFLIDTGADCTVFSAEILNALGLPPAAAGVLTGVGGAVPSVSIKTTIRMQRDDGAFYSIQQPFEAFTAPLALDMSLLGRDVLDVFAVIVDRPGNIVCLLKERHQYAIVVV